MLTQALIISLQIVAVYVLFQQGMLFGWLRVIMANVFDKVFGLKVSRYLQKPLWDCFNCMSSVWTIIFSWSFNVPLMLAVCGLNYIIGTMLINKEDA